MHNKTVEISITVDMYAISPTHGAYIHIDSITTVTDFGKLATFTVVMSYNNMRLEDVSCFGGTTRKYFTDITVNI